MKVRHKAHRLQYRRRARTFGYRERVDLDLAIDALAKSVKAGFALRAGDGGQEPYDTATAFLKRAVYEWTRARLTTVLPRLASNRVASPFFRTATEVSENPFHWTISMILDEEFMLKRQDVHRFALELAYAHLHQIPPSLLIGFIYQCGGIKRIRQRLKNKQLEAWHATFHASQNRGRW